MYKLSIAEYQFATTTPSWRKRIVDMGHELSSQSGIDWQLEFRWMTMTDENYFIAKLKYMDILKHLTVTKI